MSKNAKTKKVGLVTCFLNNYGACLQAYALENVIDGLGYNCFIINYYPPEGYIKPSYGIKKLIMQCFSIMPSLFVPKRYKDYYCSGRYEFDRQFDRFRNKYLRFDSKHIHDEKSILQNPSKMDTYVCGSDQIWNPTFYGGNNKIYLLKFVPDGKKRIAYAPSIGINKIPEQYEKDFINLINRYSTISVREDAGAKIVKELTGRDCRVVLDPTLLISRSNWIKLIKPPKITKPYIFLYLFGTRDFIGEFIEHIKNIADIPIVAIPFTEREKANDFKKLYSAGPLDFVSLIANASLVITDSFHATAFSINLNIPFYALLRDEENNPEGMNSRIHSILHLTGLNNRLIFNKSNFPKDLNSDMDFSDSNNRLNKKRKEDIDFLREALKE